MVLFIDIFSCFVANEQKWLQINKKEPLWEHGYLKNEDVSVSSISQNCRKYDSKDWDDYFLVHYRKYVAHLQELGLFEGV